MKFDQIAVLDAGRLVEFDTPKNLLAGGGLFNRMYNAAIRRSYLLHR